MPLSLLQGSAMTTRRLSLSRCRSSRSSDPSSSTKNAIASSWSRTTDRG